jgi:hypothetical protein
MRFYSFIGKERQQAHIELGERRKEVFEKAESEACQTK